MIEVGEFIRTKKGRIGKVTEIIKAEHMITGKPLINYALDLPITQLRTGCVASFNIVKHSKNILDLIEVGDIVNGHLVTATYLDGATKYIKLDNAYSVENNFSGIRIYKKDIKTILTHEQYNQNSYKVEK